MSQNFLTLSPLVGSWGKSYFKGVMDGYCWIYHSKVVGWMGSFREISPGSHPCVDRTPQAIYLSMDDSLPAAGLQGNLGPGDRERRIGNSKQTFNVGKNSKWEGVEDHSSGEGWTEWQWKWPSWEKCGAEKSWGLRTRISACICLQYWRSRLKIKYIFISKWRGHLRTTHTQETWDLFFLWQGFFWPFHLYHPLSREQAETMHESQKVFWIVFCFNKYMLIKEDSFIWKIPAVTCEISVTMTPLSLPISSTARSRSLPSS